MTNQPIDQAKQHALQDEMDELGNRTDPVDIYALLAMLADDEEMEFADYLNTHLVKDILRFSQSNLEGIHENLLRQHAIDNLLADL